MKITDVRTVLLTGPCTNDPFLSEARRLRSASFIEVHTDRGLVGIGETYAGYFCPELVPGIVDFFRPILIGQSPDEIDELWRRMYHCANFWCRVGVGAIVLTGIEAALWDLRGKALGRPVHELLGGCRHERLPCYATGGPSNYPRDRLAAKLDHYLGLGFRAVKVGAGAYVRGRGFLDTLDDAAVPEFEGEKARFMRGHVGPDVALLFDAHMGNSPAATWDLATAAAVMRAVAPAGIFLYEEPLPYADAAAYAELARSSPVPIAGGECLTTCEWRGYVERDAFAIGQPDASFIGGLREFMRVAADLERRGRRIATHAWGAGGSLMQNIHCGFAAANTCMLELPPNPAGLHLDVVGESLRMKDGHVLPPQTPGLGIVLTDEIKHRYPFMTGSGEFNSVPGKRLIA
jgi:galactonate dehydratase